MVKSILCRVSPNFHKLIKQVQGECRKNNKRVLTSEEITSRISKKLTKEQILYNNYIRF